MNNNHEPIHLRLLRDHRAAYVILIVFSLLVAAGKFSVIHAGAPYVTIDDNTLFNAGFIVWFGEAPPQRMYAESWLVGLVSIATYLQQLVQSGHVHQLGLNLVADAYRDFQNNPTPYVLHYRQCMLAIDIATAWLVFFLCRQIHGGTFMDATRPALLAALLYLLSYNTLWCYLVARPDTCTAFFAVLGSYWYFRANTSTASTYFYAAAVAFGCAAGFKLHAAFFVIFIAADQIRKHGLRQGIYPAALFSIIAFFVFCLTAGSPLFDPLLYAKLRVLNAADDASPWIHWGDEFLVILRGTGWLTIPIIVLLAIKHRGIKSTNTGNALTSALFISILFLIFFAAIRQLRAYWMLPTLPLFYSLAAVFINQQASRLVRWGVSAVLVLVFAQQSYQQLVEFKLAQYNQMQDWVKANVKPDEPIYIIGYDTLFLPKNTQCLQAQKQIIIQQHEKSLAANESFTLRHIRLWEEHANLLQIDILNGVSDTGFNYYSLNSAPIEDIQGIVDLNSIRYLLVLKGIATPEAMAARAAIGNHFTYVTTVNAPGGKAGTGGLPYDIYARNP